MNCAHCLFEPAQYRESGSTGLLFCSDLCQAKYYSGDIWRPPFLKIRVVTWNMGDNKKSEVDWANELRQKWELLTKTDDFHVLFLTVQEDQKSDTFGRALAGYLKRYDMYKTSSKLLAPTKFFVHSYAFFDGRLNIGKDDVTRASTCLKTICTKSTTGISLDMEGVELIFMGSHFPVNPKDKVTLGNGERLEAAQKSFETVFAPLTMSKSRYVAFWAGDFNFRRIDGRDQLTEARKTGHFEQFKEGVIKFPPTCKMRKDCDRPQSDTTDIPECYVTKRAPSHCDRVLYDSKSVQVQLMSYQSYGDAAAIQNSDHNLVYADFLVYLK